MLRLNKVAFMIVVSVILSLVFIGRAYYLQIIMGSDYQKRALANYTRLVFIPAPRGTIYSSDGKVLAEDRYMYSLSVIPVRMTASTVVVISRNFGLTEDEVKTRLAGSGKYPFQPVPLIRGLEGEDLWKAMKIAQYDPAILVEAVPVRVYPYGELFAHVVGYVGQINVSELRMLYDKDYRAGDVIGKVGVERYYEDWLRGRKGVMKIVVNARGQVLSTEIVSLPQKGKDIVLNIRFDYQKALAEAFEKMKYSGAGLLVRPSDGAILAYYSHPSFDPNVFVRGVPENFWSKWSEHHNLYDRVASSLVPPASTFKVVTALAGLSSGVITPKTVIHDPGYLRIGNMVLKDWIYPGSHGDETVVDAIKNSCDVFFWKVAMRMSPEDIWRVAHDFWLDEKPRVDVPGAVAGYIPSPKTKKPWYLGDTLNMAIGQGDVQLSPLLVAQLYVGIANDGVIPDFRVATSTSSLTIRNVSDVYKPYYPLIKKGLHLVVQKGTARIINIDNKLGGKTGTAEIGLKDIYNTWVVFVWPYDKPRVVGVIYGEKTPFKSWGLAGKMKDYIQYVIRGEKGEF